MWPFKEAGRDTQGAPLRGAATNQVDSSRSRAGSASEIEQARKRGPNLRSSSSFASLKLVPQLHGLYIPPGATVSQSSDVFAQGHVSSPRPRSEDFMARRSKQESSVPVGEDPPQKSQETKLPPNKSATVENDRTNERAEAKEPPRQVDRKTETFPQVETNPTSAAEEAKGKQADEKDGDSSPQPIVEAQESATQGPKSLIEFPMAHIPDSVSTLQSSKGLGAAASLQMSPGMASAPPSVNESLVPIIRVMRATASEEISSNAQKLAASTSGPEKSISDAPEGSSGRTVIPLATISNSSKTPVQEPFQAFGPDLVSELLEDSNIANETHGHPALPMTDGSMPAFVKNVPESSQFFQGAALPVVPVLSQNPNIPQLPQIPQLPEIPHLPEMPHLPDVVDIADLASLLTIEVGQPGVRKLVIRKARKVVVNRFVLRLLLGRQLANLAKPVLGELAKPSVRAASKAKFNAPRLPA